MWPSADVTGLCLHLAGTPARLALAIQAATTIEEKLARQITLDRLDSTRRFLANVSHEVRTPMSVIQGYVHLLRDSLDAPEHMQGLDAIERNGTHLIELLDDILNLSRIEAGKLEVAREPFLLSSLVFDIAALWRGLDVLVCRRRGSTRPCRRAARPT